MLIKYETKSKKKKIMQIEKGGVREASLVVKKRWQMHEINRSEDRQKSHFKILKNTIKNIVRSTL